MKRNDISQAGPMSSFLSSVDFYRRVPKDLTEATSLGVTMSMIALLIMITLFFAETIAFISTNYVTDISLDDNTNPEIEINFNLTFRSLQCEFLSVDVLDSLGTNRQNITKNVEKWHLDSDGVRRIYGGKNREYKAVMHEEHDDAVIEELFDSDRELTVVKLTSANIGEFLQKHEMAFINFFAPWCIWCQRLHPTWEKFGKEAHEQDMPLGIGSVDCVANAMLCKERRIFAFPTLRWFVHSDPISPDYKQDRTVNALLDFAKRKFEMNERFKNWEERSKEHHKGKEKKKFNDWHGRPEYPGCQVSGVLMVNRVKGNFHVEAKSTSHNINSAMANLSHTVNHLSFGTTKSYLDDSRFKRLMKRIPSEYQEFTPMDAEQYDVANFHQAYHHYIKVVSTHVHESYVYTLYQFLQQSQIVKYKENDVPEARFSYDISPMSVTVKADGMKWYDYLTSLFAIIGGTFTSLGLIDSVLYRTFKPKKL